MLALVIVLAFWLLWAARGVGEQEVSEDTSTVIVVLVCLALVGYGYLGYLLFALPLLRALALPPGWLVYLLVAVWLIGSWALINCLFRWREGPPEKLPLLRETGELNRRP